MRRIFGVVLAIPCALGALALAVAAHGPLLATLLSRRLVQRAVLFVVAWVLWLPGLFAASQLHRPHVTPTWPGPGRAPRSVEVESPDGLNLVGWYFAGATPEAPLVILIHGMGASRADVAGSAGMLQSEGFAVAAFDNRGHGDSDGMTITFGVKERADVGAIVKRLTQGQPNRPVALMGCSLGASIALQAAEDLPQVRAVVAEAPFYDLALLSRERVSSLPPPLPALAMASFGAISEAAFSEPLSAASPAEALKKRPDLEVLLLAGGLDHMISPEHAQHLARLGRGQVELWMVPSAGHCGVWAAAPREYPRRVAAKLRAAFQRARENRARSGS